MVYNTLDQKSKLFYSGKITERMTGICHKIVQVFCLVISMIPTPIESCEQPSFEREALNVNVSTHFS